MNFLARVAYIYIFCSFVPNLISHLAAKKCQHDLLQNWYNIPVASLKDTATFSSIFYERNIDYTQTQFYVTTRHTVAKPFILAPDRRIIYQASHSGRNRKRFSFNGQNLCQLHEDMQKIIKLYWRCCCYAWDH